MTSPEQMNAGPIRPSWWEQTKAKYREPEASFPRIQLNIEVAKRAPLFIKRHIGRAPTEPVLSFPPNQRTFKLPFSSIYFHLGRGKDRGWPTPFGRMTWSRHQLDTRHRFLAIEAERQIRKGFLAPPAQTPTVFPFSRETTPRPNLSPTGIDQQQLTDDGVLATSQPAETTTRRNPAPTTVAERTL